MLDSEMFGLAGRRFTREGWFRVLESRITNESSASLASHCIGWMGLRYKGTLEYRTWY